VPLIAKNGKRRDRKKSTSSGLALANAITWSSGLIAVIALLEIDLDFIQAALIVVNISNNFFTQEKKIITSKKFKISPLGKKSKELHKQNKNEL